MRNSWGNWLYLVYMVDTGTRQELANINDGHPRRASADVMMGHLFKARLVAVLVVLNKRYLCEDWDQIGVSGYCSARLL